MTDLRELLRSGAPATAEPDVEAIRARGASRARRQRIARGGAAVAFVAVAAVGLVAVTGDSNDASTTIADSPERSGDGNNGRADDPLVEPGVEERIGVDERDGEIQAEAEGRATVEPGEKQAPPDGPDTEVSPPGGSGDVPVPQPEPGPGSAPPPTEEKPAPDSRPAYTEDTNENATGSPFCAPGTAVADGSNAAGMSSGSACSYEANSGRTARRGDTVTTSYGECSGGGAGDVVFVFGSGQEKDVVVTNEAGLEVFRFSSTVRYVQGPHERRLESGRCIEWTGRWALVTTHGTPVPPGNYRMTTTVEADRVYPEGAEDLGTDNYRQTSSVTVTVVE